MTKIQIHITKDVLERSKMCGMGRMGAISQNCAVSFAVRDIFPNSKIVRELYFGKEFNNLSSSLPPTVLSFIKKFDSLAPHPEKRILMSPFSFEIEVPDEVIEMINIDEVKRICNTSKSLSLVTA